MAQIDPSIALGIRLPQLRDPLEQEVNVLRARAMRDQLTDNALMRQARAEEAARESEYRNVLRSSAQRGLRGADLETDLERQGFVSQAQGLRKGRLETEKEEAAIGKTRTETRKTDTDIRIKQFEQIAQTMRGVRDQASYDSAMGVVESLFGPEVLGKLPEQYSPQTVQRMLDGALSQAQALQDETTRRGQNMTDVRARAEGAANRAVTMRGQDLTNARAREANVAGGKPPPGYRFTPEGNLEAIPGGPADIKAGELGAKAERKRAATTAAAENVLGAISDARELVGVTSAGAAGQVLSRVGGTGARDLQSTLETVKGNLGFDRLQEMRDNSPTGGALGAIAVQELVALQSTVASLDQAQSPAQLMRSLDKIERHYQRWLDVVKQAEKSPVAGPRAAPMSPSDEDLIRKYLPQ